MAYKNKKYYQAGVAHLAIVIILVVVIAGALGFVAYSRMQGQQANAGGTGFLGLGKFAPPKTPDNPPTSSNSNSGSVKAPSTTKKDIPALPAPVTVTLTPNDWTLTKDAKVVNDPKYGTVLQINKVGMAADAAPLATLAGDNEKFNPLSEFNKTAAINMSKYMTGYEKDHFVAKYCVSSQQLYSNQDWSKFPYVSTYQTRIGGLGQANGFGLNGMHNDPKWYENYCKTEEKKGVTVNLSEVLKGNERAGYNTFKDGLKVTTTTYVPKSGNPPANGTIKIGNITITYTYDY